MKKLLISSFLIFIFNSSSYALNVQYNQNDLQKFNTTNECENCDLSGAILNGNHSQAILNNANLSNVSAGNIILSQAKLQSADLTDADFGNADLSQSDLQNANLTSASFIGANLSEADFSGAALYQSNFTNANLYKANLTAEQLSQIKFLCNTTLPDGSIGKCN